MHISLLLLVQNPRCAQVDLSTRLPSVLSCRCTKGTMYMYIYTYIHRTLYTSYKQKAAARGSPPSHSLSTHNKQVHRGTRTMYDTSACVLCCVCMCIYIYIYDQRASYDFSVLLYVASLSLSTAMLCVQSQTASVCVRVYIDRCQCERERARVNKRASPNTHAHMHNIYRAHFPRTLAAVAVHSAPQSRGVFGHR